MASHGLCGFSWLGRLTVFLLRLWIPIRLHVWRIPLVVLLSKCSIPLIVWLISCSFLCISIGCSSRWRGSRCMITATFEKIVYTSELFVKFCLIVGIAQDFFRSFRRTEDSRCILIFDLVGMKQQRQSLETQPNICSCRVARDMKNVVIIGERSIRYVRNHLTCRASLENLMVVRKGADAISNEWVEDATEECE